MRKKAEKAVRPAVFRNLTVVLVDTQSAGNVGSVARAMKNTGFSALALVNPCEYRNNEGYSMACKAHDVLLGAREFATLDDALDGAAAVSLEHLRQVAVPALRHRLRRNPLDDTASGERIERAVAELWT